MRFFIFILLFLGINSQLLLSQAISGPSESCPGSSETYSVNGFTDSDSPEIWDVTVSGGVITSYVLPNGTTVNCNNCTFFSETFNKNTIVNLTVNILWNSGSSSGNIDVKAVRTVDGYDTGDDNLNVQFGSSHSGSILGPTSVSLNQDIDFSTYAPWYNKQWSVERTSGSGSWGASVVWTNFNGTWAKINFSLSGTYEVSLTGDDGCGTNLSDKLTVFAGSSFSGGNEGGVNALSVFPNPISKESRRIQVKFSKSGIYRVQLFGQDGKLLQEHQNQEQDLEINLNNIGESGFYVLRSTNQETGESYFQKLVVQ